MKIKKRAKKKSDDFH